MPRQLLASVGAVAIVCAFLSIEVEADTLAVPAIPRVNNAPEEAVQQAAAAGSTVDAPNLHVPPSHRELIIDIWRRSATFRRQCARIVGSPNVLVRVHLFAGIRVLDGRAATRIGRREGRLEADIYIVQQNMFVELLAHELEHVIEQIEGVDVRLAAQHGRGRVREGAYETRRAIKAGQKVAAEVRSTW